MIHAMESANAAQLKTLKELMTDKTGNADKVGSILQVFKDCKVDEWAKTLKEKYLQTALQHLEDTAVLTVRKKPLMELAEYLVARDS